MKSKFHRILFFFALTIFGICSAQRVETDSLKRMLRTAKADTAKVNLYNKLAGTFTGNNLDSADFYTQKATALSSQINYGFGLANAGINQGNSNILLGNYADALTHFKKAQSQYESLLKENHDDKPLKNGLARTFASMGVVYTQLGNYYMALENYEKALVLYREIGQQVNISKALNNIGIVYKSQQNYPKALEYLKKAYTIQSEIGEKNAPVTLTNIGVIYFETKQYENALKYYNLAKSAFEKDDNKIGFALLYNSLGDYYKWQNNLSESFANYQKSLGLYEEMQNKFGASLALYNIGKLYSDQKRYAEAMPFATKSLDYARAIGVLDQTYHSEKLLSDLYGFLNRPVESLAHYKNYVTARDSILNQENTKKFAQAEMDFEYQKKETLLAEKNKRQTQFTIFSILGTLLLIGLILVIYNRLQVKRRLTLQKEVAEYEQKALHLQMNPHFVFNCLGAISSFIVQ
ncbi:MAG TPA: tetratricopeptide repeat protein, partial [Flavobacterium sp.]|nr:tetratricopeptide repeat protein [Flavobacterium sp.]